MVEKGKGLGGLGILITGFIAVLLGLVLIQVIGNNVEGTDVIETVGNESISITSGEGQTLIKKKVTSVTFFGNGTNSTDSGDISIVTDVNISRTGVVLVGQNITDASGLNGTIFADGTYGINYTYEGAFFVDNSTARTLLDLVMIFFAIAVIAISIMIFKRAFPDLF